MALHLNTYVNFHFILLTLLWLKLAHSFWRRSAKIWKVYTQTLWTTGDQNRLNWDLRSRKLKISQHIEICFICYNNRHHFVTKCCKTTKNPKKDLGLPSTVISQMMENPTINMKNMRSMGQNRHIRVLKSWKK